MKTTFFHDTVFIEDNGRYYTKDGLNQEVLNEYIEQFGELTIVSRIEKNNKKYINSKNEIINVRFIGIMHRYQNAINQVKEAIKDTELAIIRLPSFIGTIAIHYANIYHKKYFIEYVGSTFECLWYHSKLGKVIAPFVSIINKAQIRKAPYVLYVTKNFLQNKYKTNGFSINCSDVKINLLDEKKLKERINKINIDKEHKKFVIGTLAAIHIKYKGHRFVLKAISNLKKRGYTAIEYQVVGSGSQEYLKKIAKKYDVEDNLVFIGQLPHTEVFSWLENLDVYIQPSETEGLSRAIIEAMSTACPIIASDAGGNSELIGEKYIFKNRNTKQLELKIEKMLNNKEFMINSAKENFKNSKLYEKEYLKKRRKTFYKRIKEI